MVALKENQGVKVQNLENISMHATKKAAATLFCNQKPLQSSSEFKIQTSIRIKSQPNIKNLNLSNKITGLQSSKQATKYRKK